MAGRVSRLRGTPACPLRHSPLFPCLFDPLPVLVPPSRPQDRMTENMKECLAQTKAAVGDMVTVVKTEVCSPLRDQEYGQPW